MPVKVDAQRLLRRLDELGQIGDTGDGGVCRLALTDEDKLGRDLLVTWMHDLGLRVDVDAVGNMCGTWPAGATEAPVLCGSHLDTVRTGGRYDGNLGVLAGLEAIETVISSGAELARPLAVASFTGEEGARFAPDMLGSLVYVGGMPVEQALSTVDRDGVSVGEELARIGYAGPMPCPARPPHAYVELHIEQGPVLEAEGAAIGVVTGVQGISWTELAITGQANHAGTTPMHLRHDAGYAAAAIAVAVRELCPRVGTVGRLDLHPDLVNVVAARAVMTVDLRDTDEAALTAAEKALGERWAEIGLAEGCMITARRLARFEPVGFDEAMVDLVEGVAHEHGHTTMRLPSGAGHDAQMLARVCPTGMVFVPSAGGISHNPAEHTSPEDIANGANVLLDLLVRLAQ
ncbi:MAG: hydantoinase/carbamoylase family amidase [Acidimicrobiia bacterium]|nr:hydantoinase/carbamoylase family amidase [Acidimicrobiia bacterium]